MGGTLAEVAAAGVATTVVTATRGEAGEIHNRPDAAEIQDSLGEVRAAELHSALKALGVGDHVFLGYRDSGMMGTPDNDRADSFWGADFAEAVGRLVRIVRDRKPDVITAYDPFGGYGHPDHIQVHRVGTAAYWASADVGRYPAAEFGDPWAPARLYWATWSRGRIVEARRAASPGEEMTEPPTGSPDSLITLVRDVSAWAEAKQAALLCHDTQFPADSWVRRPMEELLPLLGLEHFTLVHSAGATTGGSDLFDWA